MKKSKFRGEIFVLLAAVMWGTAGTAQAFIPDQVNPMVVGTLRMTISGILLFLIAIFSGAFKDMKKLSLKKVFLASLYLALYQPLFFGGISQTGVALGTVLTIGSAPIFSGALELSKGHEISMNWLIATFLSILGCALLFLKPDMKDFDLTGVLLCLSAGLVYALFVNASRPLFDSSTRMAVNGTMFFLSSIMLFPVLIIYPPTWINSLQTLLPVLHLGIVSGTIGYVLFSLGLSHISNSEAVTLTLAEPLTAAILGVLILDEKLTFSAILGIITLFTGLIISTRGKSDKIPLRYKNKKKVNKNINKKVNKNMFKTKITNEKNAINKQHHEIKKIGMRKNKIKRKNAS